MTEAAPTTRFTLRQLPVPARLVIATFLMAVGIGYTSALVQMHFAQANKAAEPSAAKEPMPTFADVVLHFTGKKWFASEPPPAVSKLEAMVSGTPDSPWPANMTAAFYGKDGADYNATTKTAPPERKAKIDAERKGEQEAVIAWANTEKVDRLKAYRDDHLVIPTEKAPADLTPEYRLADGGVKIRTLLTDRCVRCHMPGAAQANKPLDTYDGISKYLEKPVRHGPFRAGGDYVRVQPPVERADLARSTHAHLLSFAMLFALTGLTFAFTSYPGIVRGVLGPLVLVAQIADIGCWWLARESEAAGPYFAMAVVGTGGLVGTGLALQIVLSLFSMFGRKGKLVLLALFAAGGGLWGAVFVTVIKPALAERKAAENANGHPQQAKPGEPPKEEKKDKGPAPAAAGRADLLDLPGGPPEKLLKPDGTLDLPWSGEKPGGMARAFFDKDGSDFKKTVTKAAADEKQELVEERETERQAVIAWITAEAAARKKAYDEDKFPLPPDLAARRLTGDYKDGPAAKIKSILNDRCARCHTGGAEKEDKLLDSYDEVLKNLIGGGPGPKAGANPPAAAAVAAAPPIPAARE